MPGAVATGHPTQTLNRITTSTSRCFVAKTQRASWLLVSILVLVCETEVSKIIRGCGSGVIIIVFVR